MLAPRMRNEEIESVHLHCDKTARYIVIYTSSEVGTSGEPKDGVLHVVTSSLKCH